MSVPACLAANQQEEPPRANMQQCLVYLAYLACLCKLVYLLLFM